MKYNTLINSTLEQGLIIRKIVAATYEPVETGKAVTSNKKGCAV